MHEALKKIAKSLSETDVRILMGSNVEGIKARAANILAYENGTTIEEAKERVEETDLMTAVVAALNEEGVLSEADQEGIKVVASKDAENYLKSSVWSQIKIGTHLAKYAAKGEAKIERDSCKHQVVSGEEGGDFGIPGHSYCSLWKVNSQDVVQIAGKCVPKKFFGQSALVGKRNSLWGVEDEAWGLEQITNLTKDHSADDKKKK